jgi:integrase
MSEEKTYVSFESAIENGWKNRNNQEKRAARDRFIKILNKIHEHNSRYRKVPKASSATIEKAWRSLMYLVVFAEQNDFKPNEYNRERYRAFCDALAESSFSPGNKACIRTYINQFIRFLFETNVIKRKFDISSESLRVACKNIRHTEEKKFIPSALDIIKVRNLQMPIEVALFFEFCLSSGMRISEMLQIRYCDLDFNEAPINPETGKRNSLCGGSVTLNPRYHQIKSKAVVKTYFSKLTLRLLKIYMRVNGIENNNSIVRVFPFSISVIQLWFYRMNVLCKFESALNNSHEEAKRCLEELSSKELEKELEGISQGIAHSMRTRLEELKKNPDRLIKSDERFGNKHKENLTAHSLRYFFISIQLFRDYRGGSMDTAFIRQLLGHRSGATIFGYILKLDIIPSEKIYTRLLGGSPGDYRKLIVRKPDKKKISLTPKGYEDVPWYQISYYNSAVSNLAVKYGIKNSAGQGTREILRAIRLIKDGRSLTEYDQDNIDKNVVDGGKFDLFEE